MKVIFTKCGDKPDGWTDCMKDLTFEENTILEQVEKVIDLCGENVHVHYHFQKLIRSFLASSADGCVQCCMLQQCHMLEWSITALDDEQFLQLLDCFNLYSINILSFI